MVAAANGYSDIVQLLVGRGAKVDVQVIKGHQNSVVQVQLSWSLSAVFGDYVQSIT